MEPEGRIEVELWRGDVASWPPCDRICSARTVWTNCHHPSPFVLPHISISLVHSGMASLPPPLSHFSPSLPVVAISSFLLAASRRPVTVRPPSRCVAFLVIIMAVSVNLVSGFFPNKEVYCCTCEFAELGSRRGLLQSSFPVVGKCDYL